LFFFFFFPRTEWPFFYSVVAVTRLAGPFTLKTAELSVPALQPSQHCCNL